eukprot:TRINITY_DN754_c0_g2_i1.p1 TRINITY_DN754_c0_g2~~TRINITY_DN754_c0_g2_i1.p1  ORF type:complete len:394 (+),score=129.10 TRINITY_DN754_c0_g2_i1:1463-2644(+)
MLLLRSCWLPSAPLLCAALPLPPPATHLDCCHTPHPDRTVLVYEPSHPAMLAMECMMAVSAVQNVAKAVGALQTLRKFERSVNDPCLEDFMAMWHELEAMDAPMRLLGKLHAREATRLTVDPAVRFAKSTITKVEEFLSSDDPADERPESRDSWMEWLTKKKEGHDKKGQLPRLALLVQRTMSTMQLTLTTVHITHPQLCAQPDSSPFSWNSETADLCTAIITEIRTGRLNTSGGKALAAGRVWKRGGGGGVLEDIGRCALLIDVNEDPETKPWSVRVVKAPQTSLKDPDFDAEEGVDIPLKVGGSFAARRVAHTNLPDGLPEDALVYELPSEEGTLYLQFEAVDRTGSERAETSISAEMFEVLLHMLSSRDYNFHADAAQLADFKAAHGYVP